MKTWIKAGLIGGIAAVVLTLPGFLMFYLPLQAGFVIASCASAVFFLLYPGVGALAAFWLPAPRTTRQATIDGLLAGLLAFGIDSVATMVFILFAAGTGLIEQYIQQILPYANSEFMAMVNPLSVGITIISVCFNVLMGAAFSAVGGLVLAALKPN